MSTALAAKRAGQARSLLDILDEEQGRFLHIIAAVPAGELFSVNRIRAELDDLHVPNKARAGLFTQAIAAHLIVPVFTPTPMGRDQQVTEASTGETAHAAHVRVYARTETQLR